MIEKYRSNERSEIGRLSRTFFRDRSLPRLNYSRVRAVTKNSRWKDLVLENFCGFCRRRGAGPTPFSTTLSSDLFSVSEILQFNIFVEVPVSVHHFAHTEVFR